MPWSAACKAPLPRINTGMYSGRISNASNRPPRFNPTVSAAPTAPSRLSTGVPSNKESSNTGRQAAGKPSINANSGASKTSARPEKAQCASTLAKTRRARGSAKGPTVQAIRLRNHCGKARPARVKPIKGPLPRPVPETRFATIETRGRPPAGTSTPRWRRIPADWPAPQDGGTTDEPNGRPTGRKHSYGPVPQINIAIAGRHPGQRVVGGQHHHAAAFAVAGQVFFELRHALFIERGEGFIENPQRRAVEVKRSEEHTSELQS